MLHVTLETDVPASPGLEYAFNPPRPFLPVPEHRDERCEEIISIQTAGIAKRMEHARVQRLVIGISGGWTPRWPCSSAPAPAGFWDGPRQTSWP